VKRSAFVSTGIVLASVLLVACSSEPDQEFMDADADHQQVCVKPQPNGELERRPDHECADQDDDGHMGGSTCAVCWYFLGRAYGTPPAVGQKIPSYAPGSYAKPSTGTVARPPATGGFGVTRVTTGAGT
jgi:hypothetical protein